MIQRAFKATTKTEKRVLHKKQGFYSTPAGGRFLNPARRYQ
jgi:hypothetical protein